MHLGAKRLAHLPATNIGNSMQSQAVEKLVMIQQILPDAVDDEVQQLVLFVQEERHGKIADLLFGILLRRYEVDRLEMAKVDVPPQYINVQQLADILLLVVAAEAAVLEFLSNIGQLLVYALLLQLASSGVSQIGDELHKAAHVGIAIARAAEKAASRG